MLRRTAVKANKAPQTPGPMMQGWGRTAQKRRLEYESVENKYGERAFNKHWDVMGLEQRSTEHKQVRMYYNYPQRQVAWMWNMATQYFVPVSTAVVPIYLLDKAAYKLDKDTKRAAWW